MKKLLRKLFGKKCTTFLGIYQTDQGPLQLYAVGDFEGSDKFKKDFEERLTNFRWCKHCRKRTWLDTSCSYCNMMKHVGMDDGQN